MHLQDDALAFEQMKELGMQVQQLPMRDDVIALGEVQ